MPVGPTFLIRIAIGVAAAIRYGLWRDHKRKGFGAEQSAVKGATDSEMEGGKVKSAEQKKT